MIRLDVETYHVLRALKRVERLDDWLRENGLLGNPRYLCALEVVDESGCLIDIEESVVGDAIHAQPKRTRVTTTPFPIEIMAGVDLAEWEFSYS